ncbi:MAG: penicillin-binding protein 1C [Spirochaetia bacterium]|nr:penicillin-binding protein 1C [Spirochaetia bacterium]
MTRIWKGALLALSAAALCIAAGLWYLFPIRQNISLSEILSRLPSAPVLLDRNGRLLHEGLGENGLRSETLFALDKLPPHLIHALLAAEDHRFYSHVGFDPKAIARAFWANLRARKILQGGSTLSQQTASLLWPRTRTFAGKCLEIRDARWLERCLSKNEILLAYLNLAPFGNRIQGISRASRIYFGKEPALLSTAESAFLISIPSNPTRRNPWKSFSQVQARQERILRRMKEEGFLNAEEWSFARAQMPAVQNEKTDSPAPHFVAFLQKHFPEKIKGVVRTSLDVDLQETVQALVREQVERLGNKNAASAACVVLDNRTGEVRAWVGSPDFARIQVDGADILRQPGSSVKPFTYLLALSEGFSAASVLPDIRESFPAEGGTYEPANYSREYHGPVRLREALANSYNLPAVFLLNQIGVPRLQNLFRQMNLGDLREDAGHYGLGLTLGNAELRLWQLANAYRMIARDGVYSAPVFLMDKKSESAVNAGAPLFEAEDCALLKNILSDDRSREAAFGRGGYLNPGFPVAAKTGTSQDFKDNFALGFSDAFTVGVWVGNPDRRAMKGVSGISGAGPIFSAVFQTLHRHSPQTLSIDETFFENKKICALSGDTPGTFCPHVLDEIFLKNRSRVDEKTCEWHQAGGLTLPAQYAEWLRRSRENHAQVAKTKPIETLAIQSPKDRDHFMLDPRLGEAGQGIPVRVATSLKSGKVEYVINGEKVAEAGYPFRQSFFLKPGEYTLSLRHESGASSRPVSFVVE